MQTVVSGTNRAVFLLRGTLALALGMAVLLAGCGGGEESEGESGELEISPEIALLFVWSNLASQPCFGQLSADSDGQYSYSGEGTFELCGSAQANDFTITLEQAGTYTIERESGSYDYICGDTRFNDQSLFFILEEQGQPGAVGDGSQSFSACTALEGTMNAEGPGGTCSGLPTLANFNPAILRITRQ